ncbi:MFS transporter [Kocuria sp. 2SI]|uniref:MFS transporter n=1 Tax=Kocuria sp. 2SI TaxID=2502203 RepID=UPI001485C140|nr:MFS transporter [Kocuria sp. 2SI]
MTQDTRRSLPGWLMLLFIATLALGTDEFVISGILPDVAGDFGVTAGRAGLLVTAFALAFCLGSPIAAVATDRLDKKVVLVGGLIVFAIANGLMAVVDTFWLAIVLRILAGVAAGAVSPTAMAIAGTRAPSGSEGRYLAVATAGLTVALFTGVPIGTWVGQMWSWRGTFILIAVVALIVAVLSALLTPRVPGNEPTPLSVRLGPVRDWQVLSLVLAMFLCGAGGLTFYSFLGTTVERELGAAPGNVTWTLLLVGVVGVVAVFGGGSLADSKGPRVARLVIVGGHAIALLAVGIYLALGGGFGLWFLVLVSVWSLFAWALSPAMQASIIAVDPQRAMLSAALGISGLYGGAGVGAAIGGALIDNLGAASIPLVASAFVAAAWLLTTRKDRPIAPEETPAAAGPDAAGSKEN